MHMFYRTNSQVPKATTPKTLIVYADEYGNELYVDWIDKLRDKMARKRIQSRLRRLEAGLIEAAKIYWQECKGND